MKTPLKKTKSIATAAATALIATQIATAATLTLNPTDDSLIRANQGNNGGNNLVLIGDTTNANDFLRGAFAFDLSNPVLAGATVNSATLTLTIDATDTGGSANESVTINFHELGASFTNSGVTWTSRNGTDDWTTAGGDFGGVLASQTTNAATVNADDELEWSNAALDAAAENAIGSTLYLLGKLAVEDTDARNIFRFDSSSLSTAPTLTIDYTAIPEPSSASLLLFAGLLLGGRRRR